ncbi:hypothetical protein ACFC8N_47255 [Streptomyces sp. NPDC055966]|uniref:hypothetical protein n=1 Tax=Streptomyces sp. NPDC055966 TaxID=3345669 RepID=UPI0035DBCD1E
MGVILWYRVTFPTLNLTVSNDVSGGLILSDAEITVTYGLGQPGAFSIDLAALPLSAQRKLATALTGARGDRVGGVEVEITLGYLESPGSREPVLKGRVDGMTVSRRADTQLGVLLTGFEEAAFQLVTTKELGEGKGTTGLAHYSRQEVTPAEAAEEIVGKARAELRARATPTGSRREITLDAPNAFVMLQQLAGRFDAELLVQDGTVQFGQAVTSPPSGPGPALPSDPSAAFAALSGEDALIAPATGVTARLAAFAPVQASTAGTLRVVNDLPEQTSVGAFDFTVLGTPALRAGQLVAASVDGYQNPLKGYRIIQLTHSFSPRNGYVCTGRAAVFTSDTGIGAAIGSGGGKSNRKNTEAVREGSPFAIADAIAGRIRDARTVSPSVDAGQIRSAKPDRRSADVAYGQGDAPAAVSPSVDLMVDEHGPVLHDKPLAAPFAWHNVGLSVPVYEGMRALLNDVRGSRDDSVVTGFLWANDPAMDRPRAKAGDWWLCLPTGLSAGPDPRPEGKGVNDLTAADGRRVVEAVGLKLTVGTSACSAVGERPAEGTAEEFLLSHSSGTEVRIDRDGNVAVTSKCGKATVTAGPASVTVGDSKVAVTVGGASVTVDADKVAVSAGGASLTVGQGKVAIG